MSIKSRMLSVGLGGHAQQRSPADANSLPLTLPEATYFTRVSILNIGMYIRNDDDADRETVADHHDRLDDRQSEAAN